MQTIDVAPFGDGRFIWAWVQKPNSAALASLTFAITDLEGVVLRNPETIPPAVPPVDVGAVLDAGRLPNAHNWLRVTAVLQASPDRLRVPVLKSFELNYRCIDRD